MRGREGAEAGGEKPSGLTPVKGDREGTAGQLSLGEALPVWGSGPGSAETAQLWRLCCAAIGYKLLGEGVALV